MPKWFFMAQSQNKTAAGLWRKTHTHSVCRTSWHACSSADKHMVDITQWLLSCRNQWTVGRRSRCLFFFFSFLVILFLSPFYRCRNTGIITGCNVTPSRYPKGLTASLILGQKCVKGSRLNRWDNQSPATSKSKQHIKWTKVVTWTYLWSRRIGISKLWIWHGREVPQYPEIKRDWRSPL